MLKLLLVALWVPGMRSMHRCLYTDSFFKRQIFFKKICPILQILHRCIRPAVLHLQHASHDAPAMRGEVAAMSEPPRRNGWLG
jgi:hypothetical protein